MTTPASAWSLDPQLERDTVPIGDLPLARILVMNDATYPWLILVPRVPGAVELIDLDDEQQAQLMDEIAMLSRVLKDVTGCDKLNVAAIGNVVAQLARACRRAPARRSRLAASGVGPRARPPLRPSRSSTASLTASGGRLHSAERLCCVRHKAVPASRALRRIHAISTRISAPSRASAIRKA